MAAYAALVSLINIMEQIRNHTRLSASLRKNQTETLLKKLNFLLDFIETCNNSDGGRERVEKLEREIASAAHAAEDVIESRIVDLISAESSMSSVDEDVIESHIDDMTIDLRKVIDDIESIEVKVMEIMFESKPTYPMPAAVSSLTQESSTPLLIVQQAMKIIVRTVMKFMELWKVEEEGPTIPKSALPRDSQFADSATRHVIKVKKKLRFKEEQLTSSSSSDARGMNTMVGFDGYLLRLLEALTGQQPARQIIPIVGMAGIGKTTLARNVYDHSVIVHYFEVRAWANVSQSLDSRQIILGCLALLGESSSRLGVETEHELGIRLYKLLYGRRYLIVLDDLWSIEAWDKIDDFFPDNNNKSRIIVTTRQSGLFKYSGSFKNSGTSQLAMDFLDEDESWDLFCQKAFAQEACPPDLVGVGKRIVRKLQGYPLLIVVIGGLLGKSSKTRTYWIRVAKNIRSTQNSKNFMSILSLSYTHLPACLKPCFLYMGSFPKGHEIRVSRLIKLWVAEGFLKPNLGQSLEAVAKGYLNDLIARNLVLVSSLGSNGKLKSCKIHDLLRDLCLKVAEKEKFFGVMRVVDSPQDNNRDRRIIIQGSIAEKKYDPPLFHPLGSTSLARTLICETPSLLSTNSRLLRVLIEVYSASLDTTFQQANLRFLAYESIRSPIGLIHTYKLPSSISLLWNLQTLIIDKSIAKVVAPSEIWKMPQLQHLQFHRISLPDPPLSVDFVLQNLHTLRTVLDFRCSIEVCRRMPNIKKLCIFYDDFSGKGVTTSWYGLYNVGDFNRLESLCCYFHIVPDLKDFPHKVNFPRSLKKLRLQDSELNWSDLTIIGSLPRLEVLKLKCQSVRGREWNPVYGEFPRLKLLEIDSCYLIHWNADSYHFPVLKKLVLSRLCRLNKIPQGIGKILSLQNIYVVDCSVSAAISAIQILHERESLGIEGLQVRVKLMEKAKLEEFMEKLKLDDFTSNNFQVDGM